MLDEIENVSAAEAHRVLRQQPERRHTGEEVPAAKRPVITVLCADHA